MASRTPPRTRLLYAALVGLLAAASVAACGGEGSGSHMQVSLAKGTCANYTCESLNYEFQILAGSGLYCVAASVGAAVGTHEVSLDTSFVEGDTVTLGVIGYCDMILCPECYGVQQVKVSPGGSATITLERTSLCLTPNLPKVIPCTQ